MARPKVPASATNIAVVVSQTSQVVCSRGNRVAWTYPFGQETGMGDARRHEGGCHCGAVRYQVDMALDGAISCNCSMCQKKGTLLSFVPTAAFALQSGEDHLTDYQFNTGNIHHLFCRTCGVTSFARGQDRKGNDMVAVNVRCLDGVELEQVAIKKIDGRSF